MIIVFVWSMGAADWPGHASIMIDRTYISWYPEPAREGTGFGGVRGRGHAAWGGPSYVHSMTEDKEAKGRPPDFASAPIRCLDESAMLRWWDGVRPKNLSCKVSYSASENTHYDLARMSCATVVMKALLAGGSGKIVKPSPPIVATAAKAVIGGFGGLPAGAIAEAVIGQAVSPLDVQLYVQKLEASDQNR